MGSDTHSPCGCGFLGQARGSLGLGEGPSSNCRMLGPHTAPPLSVWAASLSQAPTFNPSGPHSLLPIPPRQSPILPLTLVCWVQPKLKPSHTSPMQCSERLLTLDETKPQETKSPAPGLTGSKSNPSWGPKSSISLSSCLYSYLHPGPRPQHFIPKI